MYGLYGLGLSFLGLLVVYIAAIRMRMSVNKEPGSQGRVPLYALLPKMQQPFNLVERYRHLNGNDTTFKLLVTGLVLVGVGLLTVFSIQITERIGLH